MTFRADTRTPDFNDQLRAFLDQKRESVADVSGVVLSIIERVRAEGDTALFDLTKELDGHDINADTIRVSQSEIEEALRACKGETLDALALAAARIRTFHEKQVPSDLEYTDDAGVKLGYRWSPVQAAGLYVPGGTAAYPSSVLMNALPAKAAGVDRLAMVVPASGGALNPYILGAAHIAGVSEIYRIGGAQAVAALAYGTASVAPVNVIVGPGNVYVATAKRHVYGQVGIDMIAGPSEILVVADGQNNPDWIAADLLSQAEHDTNAQSILITDDAAFADAVCTAVERHLKALSRADIARKSWATFGAVIVVGHMNEALAIIDDIAPEHLELAVEVPEALADKIHNAGAIFLGRYTPEALGDYVAGPNHVLPTDSSAKFSSGLGVFNFMKRTSLIGASPESLREIGPAAVTLAETEGLDAHAASVLIRLEPNSDE
ncbi:MAG: histidinol dehydrogenase [Rhodospirillaceae bacterium TMED167]|nr:histidinol dehydrogenase [Rhodospirillaceae bacterium]OUW24888.1 MAG: histidinol dehydrogenase [Rhodospirillaceae bacterium TMED167]